MGVRSATESDVVIIGAGPVGLGTALELAQRGVRVTVIEQSDRLSRQPRAKLVNVRSMSLLRRWGIADRAREAAPLGSNWPGDIAFVTELLGFELARLPNALMTQGVPGEVAPESALTIPQGALEQVMSDRLAEHSLVRVCRGAKFMGVEQGADGVRVMCRDEVGTEFVEHAAWLVGCDGARSDVRDATGITMSGRGTMGRNLGAVFRCDGLAGVNRHADAAQYWVVNPTWPGIMGRLDTHGLWWAQLAGFSNDHDLQALDVAQYIQGMVGRLDVEIEILGTDPWAARELLAQTYRSGRVLLAGDAAHLHPPMGGYGMNMGLGDAFDLGWRLSAILDGWAGPDLLDGYVSERREVHQRVLKESMSNYGRLSQSFADPRLSAESAAGYQARDGARARIVAEKTREFSSIGMQLGCAYTQSRQVVYGRRPVPDFSVTDYEPCSAGGRLAPHLWMEDGVALYDVLGPGLTVLVHGDRLDPPSRAMEKLDEAAQRIGVPLSTVHLPESALTLYPSCYTLVRPDQYVAYAGPMPGVGWEQILRTVTASVGQETTK